MQQTVNNPNPNAKFDSGSTLKNCSNPNANPNPDPQNGDMSGPSRLVPEAVWHQRGHCGAIRVKVRVRARVDIFKVRVKPLTLVRWLFRLTLI